MGLQVKREKVSTQTRESMTTWEGKTTPQKEIFFNQEK